MWPLSSTYRPVYRWLVRVQRSPYRLVLDALEQALYACCPAGQSLIQHCDRGV
tara:strand:- start:22616 stop:22774 length:159 start_codon:yes stop_codon:yes gene_type:complete